MNSKPYTIQELCDQTGLPRRTIHFYSQQGIIPPPTGAGLGATYSDIHLLRLKLVPLLRHQGLRLDEIRARLDQTPPADLQRVIQSLSTSPAPLKPRASAQHFIHYSLPAGLVLISPADLNPADRTRLDQLLKSAQDLFSPTLSK